jgi:hypothetical protein
VELFETVLSLEEKQVKAIFVGELSGYFHSMQGACKREALKEARR